MKIPLKQPHAPGGSLPRLVGPAPVDLQLDWLIEGIVATKQRFEAMRTDVLGLLARPPESQEPRVTSAKLNARLSSYGQIIQSLDYLLGERRPWMRTRPNE